MPCKGSYLSATESGILAQMNTRPTEFRACPPSLREVLASQGIESSYRRDRRRARRRLQGMITTQTETPIPGIEVTYLEIDLELWEQIATPS